jgi:hypothetical protein
VQHAAGYLDEILDGGPEVAADRQLLEGDREAAARMLARLAPREDVPKLRVGELVQTPCV